MTAMDGTSEARNTHRNEELELILIKFHGHLKIVKYDSMGLVHSIEIYNIYHRPDLNGRPCKFKVFQIVI